MITFAGRGTDGRAVDVRQFVEGDDYALRQDGSFGRFQFVVIITKL